MKPVALVTGASRGIGRAIAIELSSTHQVLATYRGRKDAAESLRAETGAEIFACDIGAGDDRRALLAFAKQRFGQLDLLVNNAGTTRFIPHPDLDALTDEVWDEILGVNLKGTFYCCRAAAPELRKRNGAIVNVSSISAYRATGSSIAYAVSKAGIVQLTRALARSLAPDVRVNSVSPGLVSTRWFRSRLGDDEALAQEETFANATPLQRIASPEDVAHAVVSLLENDLITGQDLVVDGGKNILY